MRVFMWMGFVSAIYFLCDALSLVVDASEALTVVCSIICSCLAPVLPWMGILFFWCLYTDHQKLKKSVLWFFVIPFSHGLITTATFALIGLDSAVDFIHSGRTIPLDATTFESILFMIFNGITIYMYNTVVAIGLICLLCFTVYVNKHTDYKFGDLGGFLLGRNGIKPLSLEIILYGGIIALSGVRMSFSREFFLSHEWILDALFLTLTLLISIMGIVGLKMHRPIIFLSNHKHLNFEDLPIHIHHNSDFSSDNSDSDDIEDSFSQEQIIKNEEANTLRGDFHILMRDNEIFLEPGMSRYRVCDFLNISTKKLDKSMMQFYGVTYQEYVQLQRVAYLERYIKVRPDLPIRLIAAECGFQSVQEMRGLYKEIKGEPFSLPSQH